MGYLDSSGLSHFWAKVKTILSGKQDSLTIGDGLNLNGNTIGVTEPVKSITKAEYDALTNEEKNSGLYVITDMDPQEALSGATFTPSVSAEGDLSWTNDKGLPNPEPVNIKGPQGEQGPQGEDISDVYFTDETRIGTWIDGKPLYRKVVSGTTAFRAGAGTQIYSIPGIYLIDVRGIMTRKDSGYSILPDLNTTFFYDNGYLCMFISNDFYINSPCVLTIEYTKTTDLAPTSQTNLLTSEVNSLYVPPSVSYAPASASSANNAIHIITESPGSSGNF